MARSKNITIYLRDADPNGVKIADLSNSTARVYVLPRHELSYAKERADLNTPAFYMLFNDERTDVYIGESENFNKRVIDHEAKKAFWQWAVVCIATGAGLDKAEVKFLESHAVTLAVGTNRFNVLNRTSPNLNNLHEFKKASVLDYFADVELLLATLGFNVFEPEKAESESATAKMSSDQRQFDTIICPGDYGGYHDAFEEKSAWWAVRIGKANISKLKYVSVYISAPVSAIISYARITEIEPIESTPGKYKIHHDGQIVPFEPKIKLGPNPNLSLQSSRYFLLEDMLRSKDLTELTRKAFS